MKFIIKLNVLSAVYAFVLFIALELMVNVYRITRLTKWELGTVIYIGTFVYLIGFILCTILFPIIIRSWLEGRLANFWSILFWVPYFALFVIIFTSLFPLNNPGDKPSSGTGLIIIGSLISYPIYLMFINIIGISTRNSQEG